MAERIDDHPLTDKQISSYGHRTGKDDVGDDADKGPITEGIAHMCLEEGDVVLVVGPLAEEVEGSVEEAVHEGHHPWEVLFVE